MNASATLTYTSAMHCEALGPNGTGTMPVEPAAKRGGAYSPLDLLALAHASCTAMMMGKAATANHLDIAGMNVEVQLEMSESMTIRAVHARYLFPRRFSDAELRMLKAGAEMCPVHKALEANVRITMELVQGK